MVELTYKKMEPLEAIKLDQMAPILNKIHMNRRGRGRKFIRYSVKEDGIYTRWGKVSSADVTYIDGRVLTIQYNQWN